MKKYIIKNVDENFYNAASKARRDTDTIAKECGYQSVLFSEIVTANHARIMQVHMAASCVSNGMKMLFTIERGSVVLLQYPQFPVKSSYFLWMLIPIAKRIKNIKFAAIVHDLDSLRGLCGRTGIFCDQKVLPLMDIIICHNDVMKKYLIKRGIPREKLISLNLFDYLTDAAMAEHHVRDGIAIAGNLDPEKCGYIDGVHGLPLHLYGNGRETFPKPAVYHGAFPPEELPGIIQGAFGLVWDGNQTDGCEGAAGRYLRCNNPHKLSLYLSAGMPVIVWRKAAVARLVAKEGIGFAVDNLVEIPEKIAGISEDNYEQMRQNAIRLSSLIRSGKYLKTALTEADHRLKLPGS